MALKYKLPKAEFDALADPLKEHYKPADGDMFVLDGMAPGDELRRMRDDALAAKRERDALKERYKDLDPDVARTALVELEKLKGKPPADDIAKQIEAATKPLHTRLKTIEEERDTLKRERDATVFTKHIIDSASKAGVQPDYHEDVVNRARTAGFTLMEGAIRAVRGEEPVRDQKTGEELKLDDWVKGMPPGFFGRTVGSGPGGPNNSSGIVQGKILHNPTPETFSKYAAQIAKGEIEVVRT